MSDSAPRLAKFVYWTGAFDYVVGLSAAAPVFIASPPDPQQTASLIPLGAFLFFAAASLMWASKDLETRGCVVVWQALVRLSAVAATAIALGQGMVETLSTLYQMPATGAQAMLLGVCAFDGAVATVYIVGTSRMPGHTLGGLLRGAPAAR